MKLGVYLLNCCFSQVHVDYWGPGRYLHPGGARYVTFMGYMTDVTAGGFTIFPGLGLFVQPAKGDALFWLTVKNDLVRHYFSLSLIHYIQS